MYNEDVFDIEDDGYTTEEMTNYDLDDSEDESWYIYEEEKVFLDSYKPDGYYIGISASISSGKLIYANAITPSTFFKYHYEEVMGYLKDYSIIELRRPRLHIMKLIMSGEQMNVILKTHWIRIIQRTFRKIYQQQKKVLEMRKKPRSIQYFSVFGKYLDGANHFPTMKGMLSSLSSKS